MPALLNDGRSFGWNCLRFEGGDLGFQFCSLLDGERVGEARDLGIESCDSFSWAKVKQIK